MTIEFYGNDRFYTGKLPVTGIVDFMQQHGSVWYGTLTRREFSAKFNRRMFSMISELVDLENILINQQYKIDQIRFNMDLADVALKIKKWYWPGVAYDYIDWPTGNSRLFATGLTHPEPWKDMPVLAICQTGIPDFLDNPVEVKNDEQFNQLIGFKNWASDNLRPEIFVELTPDDKLSVSFKEVDPYLTRKNPGVDRFNEYLAWFNQNKPKVRVGIYTNWPEKINDSFSYWDYKILGTSPWTDIARPGTLERTTINPVWPEDIDYLLIVADPMHIDLSQLLIWMDVEHYQFADKNWRFTLISRQGANKSAKIISIADIQSMKQ